MKAYVLRGLGLESMGSKLLMFGCRLSGSNEFYKNLSLQWERGENGNNKT